METLQKLANQKHKWPKFLILTGRTYLVIPIFNFIGTKLNVLEKHGLTTRT